MVKDHKPVSELGPFFLQLDIDIYKHIRNIYDNYLRRNVSWRSGFGLVCFFCLIQKLKLGLPDRDHLRSALCLEVDQETNKTQVPWRGSAGINFAPHIVAISNVRTFEFSKI